MLLASPLARADGAGLFALPCERSASRPLAEAPAASRSWLVRGARSALGTLVGDREGVVVTPITVPGGAGLQVFARLFELSPGRAAASRVAPSSPIGDGPRSVSGPPGFAATIAEERAASANSPSREAKPRPTDP